MPFMVDCQVVEDEERRFTCKRLFDAQTK